MNFILSSSMEKNVKMPRQWWKDFSNTVHQDNNEEIMNMLNQISIEDARDEYGSSVMHYIASRDNVEIMKYLIESDCDVNIQNRYGETPLIAAVQSNRLKITKLLLDSGATHLNSNYTAEFGPLHTAVWFQFRDMVKLLLEAGADVDDLDEEYSTPLHLSAKIDEFASNEEDNHAIARMLIEAGADVNAVDYLAFTPLHWAVMKSNYVVGGMILDAHANADVMDDNFETPLHYAVRGGNIAFAKRLLDAGADIDMIDCHGMTCLHYAVKMRFSIKMVLFLLSEGATPNCTDDQGYSALHWAVRDEYVELVKILLDVGADVNIFDDEDPEGLTVLQVAAELGLKNMIELLLEHGADIHAKCNRGYSALYYAAMCKRMGTNVDDNIYLEILKLLFKWGADVNGGTEDSSKKPFNSVLIYGNVRAVKLFIEHGIDLKKTGYREKSNITALHQAALNTDKGVLKFLLNTGLYDIEEKCGSGLTALHLSAFSNKTECIKFLLRRGANTDNGNMYGETPLYSAILNGHSESVRMLLAGGADINALTNRDEYIIDAALEGDRTDIIQYVVRQVALLEVLGHDLNYVNFATIKDFSHLQLLYDLCRAELAHMQEAVIHGTVTFFQVLTDEDIGVYARNKYVIRTFKTLKIDEYFPFYHDLVTERFYQELSKQKLMKKATKGLSTIFGSDPNALHIVFYNIMQHLSKKDMLNLIEV